MKIQRVIAYGIAALILGMWVWFWFWNFSIDDPAERGQFGDKFGALNALFTGFALAGLLFTYRQQRYLADLQEQQHRELLESQQRAVELQEKHFFQASYLNALVARIEGFTMQMEIYSRDGKKPRNLVNEQNQLLYELHDALNRYRKEAGSIEVAARRAGSHA